uniref:glucuronosyltransferase n=1 Tax=Romanomermis culicivorax TaxID=13658 RepID=A0A915K4A8_ROMCU
MEQLHVSCILYIVLPVVNVESYKILFVVPTTLDSHRKSIYPLASFLGKRGHNVTIFMAGFPIVNKENYPEESENVKNRILILRDGIDHAARMESHLQFVTWYARNARSSDMTTPWRFFSSIAKDALERNGSFLNQFLFEEKWDLIVNDVIFSPLGILVALKTNSTMVCISTSAFQVGHMIRRPLPSPWSYSPTFYMPSHTYDHRNFFSRLHSFLHDVEDVATTAYVDWSMVGIEFAKYHPKMSLDVLFGHSKLAMLQFPQLLDYTQPLMRDLVYASIVCKRSAQQTTIDKGLDDFINDPDSRGTIVVAFGHMVKWSKAPNNVTHNFLQALNMLKDYRIIWQFDGNAKELPLGKHIRIMKWLPQ